MLGFLSLAAAGTAAAQTQTWVPRKGHGSASIAYQDPHHLQR
jgi:hypothetical protein